MCILPVTTLPLKSLGSTLSLSYLCLTHAWSLQFHMCSSFASSQKPALTTAGMLTAGRVGHLRSTVCCGFPSCHYLPLSLLPPSSTPPLKKSYPRAARSLASFLITGSGAHFVSFPSALHSDRHIVGAQYMFE